MTEFKSKNMETTTKVAKDMIKILPDFNNRFSMTEFLQSKGETSDMEERLDIAQEKVLSWSCDSMIWDCGRGEALAYLNAVDEIRRLTENLGSLSLSGDLDENNLLSRAHSVLQKAMAKLEEEFSYILNLNRQPLEPEDFSFRSSEDAADEYSSSSFDEESVEASRVDLGNDGQAEEEYIIDLIRPAAIIDLKHIADVMFSSNYDQECCQAYCSARRDALDECLFLLGVEKLSIEEVQRMDWKSLNGKIRKWVWAMKILVRVIFTSEKRLCDQIFGEFGSSSQFCFVEITKVSILQLLNFSEAIAIGHRGPEKLFKILDMYEGLVDLLPDIESLFLEASGSCVRTEAREVLQRLAESVNGTFTEFKIAIRRDTSTTPFAGGAIHHLTKYVMNYIKALTNYSDTLNKLLEENVEGGRQSVISNPTMVPGDDGRDSFTHTVSVMAHRLLSVTLSLESNLDAKSKLYRDISLQHIFLMNNIRYMVQKVQDSDLGTLLGNGWIREHKTQYQQHATNYERATWNRVLYCLRDDGISNPGSTSASRAIIRDRFKSFNLAFEEVYRSQTAWFVPDVELRDDLHISISLKVLPAYRNFWGRFMSCLEGTRHADRYIKFTAEDLENYLLDFFQGSPRSLHNSHRR